MPQEKSLLSLRWRKEVSKSKDLRMKKEEEFSVSYPTGFLSFDFKNGCIVHVKSEDKNFQYYSVGVVDGSFIMVIGRSESGKSTLMTQMSSNIIRPFQTSCCFIDNVESGVIEVRREKLTGFYGEELKGRYIVRNTGITLENFYERIKMIHDMKLASPEDFEYDTGLYDNRGNRIFKMEPTVYCLDSLALIMAEKFTEEEELSGQTAGMATAKNNGAVFKRIIPMLKAANIILFAINHINQNIKISQFDAKKAQLSYLKQGETLPGGNAVIYLANNIIRVDNATKLKADEGLGIAGSLVEITLLKSRTNVVGQSCTLVFDYANGFDPDLSLYQMLKQKNRINGAGAYLYIGEHSECKFMQKKFREMLAEKPEFREIFMNECIDVLSAELVAQDEESRRIDQMNITNDIMNRLNSRIA